jgi:hypothetical protein
MITTIIFSKDRACQLRLLLESLQRFGGAEWSLPYILYDYSNKEFQAGYDKLRDEYSTEWWKQTEFEKDVRVLLDKATDLICFFVDDNCIIRDLPTYNTVRPLLNIEDVDTVSLRLGQNIIEENCYTHSPIITPAIAQELRVNNTSFIAWDYTALPPNNYFGYPFSVDGHIFKTSVVKNGLTFEFKNPNELEGKFMYNVSNAKHPIIAKGICCMPHSCVINNPLNIVGTFLNKAGVKHSYTAKELNDKYLNDEIIDLVPLLEHNITCCHQELPLTFRKI